MKILVLVILSFILAVQSDDGYDVNHQVAPFADEFAASSLYDTIFSEYFNEKSNPSKENNRRPSKNKQSGYKSQPNKVKQAIVKIEKIPEYIRHKENPYEKAEYEKLVGRKGLGFDERTATSYGLRAPITAKSLEIGRKYEKKENKDLAIFVE